MILSHNRQIIFIIFVKNKIIPRIFTASKISFDTEWMKLAKKQFEEFVISGDGTPGQHT